MKVGAVLSRVKISPGFLLFLCAYYYFDPGGTFRYFVFATICHELGHLLTLKTLGVPIYRISLQAGGACLLTAHMSYRDELLSAAAGPVMNLISALLFLHRVPVFALVNLTLFLFNLLPFYPLDGGRILRCLLQLLLRGGRAAILTERIICLSCIVFLWSLGGYITCILHEGLWPVLLCAVLTVRISNAIFPEYRNFRNKRIDKSHIAC